MFFKLYDRLGILFIIITGGFVLPEISNLEINYKNFAASAAVSAIISFITGGLTFLIIKLIPGLNTKIESLDKKIDPIVFISCLWTLILLLISFLY